MKPFWKSQEQHELDQEMKDWDRQSSIGMPKQKSWWSQLDFGQKFVIIGGFICVLLVIFGIRSFGSLVSECKAGMIRDCPDALVEFPFFSAKERPTRVPVTPTIEPTETATAVPTMVPTQAPTMVPTSTPLPTAIPTQIPLIEVDCPGDVQGEFVDRCVEFEGITYVLLQGLPEYEDIIQQMMFMIELAQFWPTGTNIDSAEVCSDRYEVQSNQPCIPLDNK
jgi:hypothetical protein